MCGPFSSVAEFHDFLAALVRKSPRPEWLETCRCQLADTCGVRFSHADLSWENMLMDPPTGSVTGILDCEMGFWPEWWGFRKALFGARSGKDWWVKLMREVTTDHSRDGCRHGLGDVLRAIYTETSVLFLHNGPVCYPCCSLSSREFVSLRHISEKNK